MEIYLDNAATTPLSDPMKKYLTSILDLWGNPSSLYAKGTESKRIISDARRSVARFIHAVPDHIYFTPSGSACNTWAVRGYDKAHRHTVLYSPIAHKSILQCAEDCQYPHPLKTDCHGFIDLHDLEQRLASCHLPLRYHRLCQQRNGNYTGCRKNYRSDTFLPWNRLPGLYRQHPLHSHRCPKAKRGYGRFFRP